MITERIEVSEGYSNSFRARSLVRTVVITNRSTLYCLVRVGGNDIPNNAGNADVIIDPYHYANIPVRNGTIAVYFTATIDTGSTQVITPALIQGTCVIEFTETRLVSGSGPLANAPVTTGAGPVGHSLPWGNLGENKTVNSTFSTIVLDNYGGVRLELSNQHSDTCTVRIRFIHTLGVGVRNFDFWVHLPGYSATIWERPLTFIPQAPTNAVTLSITCRFITGIGDLTIIPTLFTYNPGVYLDNPGGFVWDNKDLVLTAGNPSTIISGPAEIYYLYISGSSIPAGDTIVRVINANDTIVQRYVSAAELPGWSFGLPLVQHHNLTIPVLSTKALEIQSNSADIDINYLIYYAIGV